MDKKSYLSNLRVLLVEDDLDTLRQMEIMLRRRCGKVYTANNGKLGIKAYESVDPDVIITDLKMPLMGGIEMSRKIREKDRETPIIITTAFDDKDIIQEYFTLQADNPNYKQILVMQCPMSAVIAEIILIQAEDTQSAMQDLQARKDKLINTDAFYPEHKEIAEQSIVGSYGDIVYFIADYDAQESEKVLLEYLKTLE